MSKTVKSWDEIESTYKELLALDQEAGRRHAALSLAISHCDGYPAMDVVQTAEEFYEFLTKKRQPAKEE